MSGSTAWTSHDLLGLRDFQDEKQGQVKCQAYPGYPQGQISGESGAVENVNSDSVVFGDTDIIAKVRSAFAVPMGSLGVSRIRA